MRFLIFCAYKYVCNRESDADINFMKERNNENEE